MWKKRNIIQSPDKSTILKSSIEQAVIDWEHEEDIYDFHSFSLRLNMLETENILLKQKFLILENENFVLNNSIESNCKPSQKEK